jgi:Zn-dependent protease
VLLSEPGPTAWDVRFSLFGIPVRIHPMFWLIAMMMGMRKDVQLPEVLIWVVALFIAILLHELGHALVIRSLGYWPWITLHGMGGLASYNPTQGRRFRGLSSGEQIVISLAGPGAGFLLAGVLVGILYATGHGENIVFDAPLNLCPNVIGLTNGRIEMFLNKVFFICVFWGLVNLLPIYPLDGGQIARELFLRMNVKDGIRQSLVLSMVSAAVFGIWGGNEFKSMLILLFFGLLAFENYQAYQAYSGRGRW